MILKRIASILSLSLVFGLIGSFAYADEVTTPVTDPGDPGTSACLYGDPYSCAAQQIGHGCGTSSTGSCCAYKRYQCRSDHSKVWDVEDTSAEGDYCKKGQQLDGTYSYACISYVMTPDPGPTTPVSS